MPQLQPGLPPPPDYYARNLRFLFREVCRRSGALLTPPERAMVTAYLAETPGAQRLFARLASRAGRWIREDSLAYPEVGDLGAALRGPLAELERALMDDLEQHRTTEAEAVRQALMGLSRDLDRVHAEQLSK